MGKRNLALSDDEEAAGVASPRARAAPREGAVAQSSTDLDMTDEAGISHNLAGQRLGRKGRDTRERIVLAGQIMADPGFVGHIEISR